MALHGPRFIRAGEHVTLADVIIYAGPRRHDYERAFTVFLTPMFEKAVARKLTIDRKTWIIRDRRLGVLAQPVNLSEWPECDLESARHDVCRQIWASACRAENLERAGAIVVDAEFGTIRDPKNLL